MAPGLWWMMVIVSLLLAPTATAAEGSGWVILHAGLTEARASSVRGDMLQLGFTRYQTGRALAIEEYAFGGAELWAQEGDVRLCPLGKPRRDIEDLLLRGQGALDAWDYEGAARILWPVMDDLACFSEPAEAVTLAKAAMYLGYALFEGDRREEARQAFTRAAAFDAMAQWDDRYPPDAGRVFGMAVDEAMEATEARLQVLDSFKLHPEVRIDGGTFPGDGGLTAGEHRMLVHRWDQGEQYFTVRLEPGQTKSLVPVDQIVDALFSGGEGHDAATEALAAAMDWTGAAEAYIAVPSHDKVYRFQASSREIRVVPGPPEGGTVATVTTVPPPVRQPPAVTTTPRTTTLDAGQRQRIAGVVVMGIGGATSTAGFVLHGSQYNQGIVETDRARYEWQRDVNVAGFVIGVAGIATTVAGLVVYLAPRPRESQVTLIPGPVTTVSGRF